jgi:protein SCO1
MHGLTGRSIFYLHSATNTFPNCVAPSRRRPLIKEVAMRVRSIPFSRRTLLAAAAATALPVPKMEEARAQQKHVHPPGKQPQGAPKVAPVRHGRYTALVASAQLCLAKGEACMKHCIAQLTTGDTSLVDCLKTVSGMLPICRALEKYAAIEGKHLRELAQLCITVNSECENECRKHADHHDTCRECAEACSACITECGKVGDRAAFAPFSTTEFRLTAHTGATWSSAACVDRPIALFFGYTSCPSICPTTLLQISSSLEQLGTRANTLQVYFVSVDPSVDTPSQLSQYLGNFDRRIVGLTGTETEVDRLAQAFGAYVARHKSNGEHAVDHTTTIYLLDRQGRISGELRHDTPASVITGSLVDLLRQG